MSPITGNKDTSALSILNRLQQEIFNRPVIGNVARGLFVEALVAKLLEPEWAWVGMDWASWDFEHPSTWVTIEVKQSAALQTWTKLPRRSRPRFDVASRTGYWYQAEGSETVEWAEEQCRPADMYIFAWHGMEDLDYADHRDATQWTFYLVATDSLPPDHKTIGLNWLRSHAAKSTHSSLYDAVEIMAGSIDPRQRRN